MMRCRHVVLSCLMILFLPFSVRANTDTLEPERPTLQSNRWKEDWSVLSNPAVPREWGDSLKYIPLSKNNPTTYLSFGANLRERYEYNDAVNFGVPPNQSQSYLLSRAEAHADLHIANQFQAFVQLQNDDAPGKTMLTPVDADKLDLEQGFIALVEPWGSGTFKFRVGRQQMAFDLQRFISVRDGPNVRQSYDAIWADYELDGWRYISFVSQPVIAQDVHCFDDYSSPALTYGGFRVEKKISALAKISSYLSAYHNENASFPSVSGSEERYILDVHADGDIDHYDWDIEGMGQSGTIANDNILAWGMGSILGYTFVNVRLEPRVGIELDAASGNQNKNSHTLETFNPLFPNGEYFTLAGYTGYTNFIHLKPSLTIEPARNLKIEAAIAAQWRESTADAIYVQPYNAIAGTAGLPNPYTGTYFQGRLDWQMTPHISNAIEIVHFDVSNAIQSVGGRDSTYVGFESKIMW